MMQKIVSAGFCHLRHIVGPKTSRMSDKSTSLKTDIFIEKCGTKALLKIISILPGKDVEKLEFEVIKTAITNKNKIGHS